jgi:hypothetical protein
VTREIDVQVCRIISEMLASPFGYPNNRRASPALLDSVPVTSHARCAICGRSPLALPDIGARGNFAAPGSIVDGQEPMIIETEQDVTKADATAGMPSCFATSAIQSLSVASGRSALSTPIDVINRTNSVWRLVPVLANTLRKWVLMVFGDRAR